MCPYSNLYMMNRVEVFRDTVRAVPSLDFCSAVAYWPEWDSLGAAAEAFAADNLRLVPVEGRACETYRVERY